MAKTNYTKAEEALRKSLEKINRDQLLDLADQATGKATAQGKDMELTPKQMMTVVEQELKWMHKQEKDIYKKLSLKKDEIKKLIEKTKEHKDLTAEEIERIKGLKKQVREYKDSQYPSKLEDSQVGDERQKHIYKRHNVREKWLPLDTHADMIKKKKEKS